MCLDSMESNCSKVILELLILCYFQYCGYSIVHTGCMTACRVRSQIEIASTGISSIKLTCSSCMIFTESLQNWFLWENHIIKFFCYLFRYVHDPSLNYNQILVPTIDTTRTTWLLNMMMKIKRPVVLVGETGTSKTATIQVFIVVQGMRYFCTNLYTSWNLFEKCWTDFEYLANNEVFDLLLMVFSYLIPL